MRNGCWIVLLFASGIAHAASFDCAKAKTPQEKAICASPSLSAADEQMAAAYRAVLAAASSEMKDEVRTDQRNWLRFIALRCNAANSTSSAVLSGCLQVYYDWWTKQLRQMVYSKAGITFVQRSITLYASPVPPPPGAQVRIGDGTPEYGTLNASWLQANADLPEWRAWNKAVEATAQRLTACAYGCKGEPILQWRADAGVDSDTSVSIGVIGKQLVTASIVSMWDGHGAHPNHGTIEFNWLLQEQRELRPEDVFLANSGWDTAIQKRCDRELHRRLDGPPMGSYESFFQPGEMQKILHSVVINPESWRLDSTGVTIIFQPYQVACYACGPGPITIPWPALKLYLNPDFVIPTQKLEDPESQLRDLGPQVWKIPPS